MEKAIKDIEAFKEVKQNKEKIDKISEQKRKLRNEIDKLNEEGRVCQRKIEKYIPPKRVSTRGDPIAKIY
jgi:uncharacterized coiled-coil DUF342 family protein